MRRGVEGANEERPTPFTFPLPDHIHQRALGNYTSVTYIDMQQADNKKSRENVHSWELDR